MLKSFIHPSEALEILVELDNLGGVQMFIGARYQACYCLQFGRLCRCSIHRIRSKIQLGFKVGTVVISANMPPAMSHEITSLVLFILSSSTAKQGEAQQ